MKILVVDDSPPLRLLLASYFESTGHEVMTLASGEEVPAALDRGAFDAVFTDVAMPGCSGWDVLHAVRASHPGLPVVLMTGWDEASVPASAEVRPDAILEKPFKLDRILEVLEAITKAH